MLPHRNNLTISPLGRAAMYAFYMALLALAASGELWFDELWTATIALKARSIVEILGGMGKDNHLLNTLWIYLIGPESHPLWLRLPSVLAGLATLAMLERLTTRWNEKARLTLWALYLTCFPLLLYFTEARGYALATAFGLGAYLALGKRFTAAKSCTLLPFWLCLVFGFLSQLSFAPLCFGLFLSALVSLRTGYASPRAMATELLKLFLPPALIVAALLYPFAAPKVLGPDSSWIDALTPLVGTLFGVTFLPPLLSYSLPLFLLLLGACLWAAKKENLPHWPLLAIMLLPAPAVTILLTRSGPVYPRYFIQFLPYLLLLLSWTYGWVLDKPRPLIKAFATGALLLAMAGNLVFALELIRNGRSELSLLFHDLQNMSDGKKLVITGDEVGSVMLASQYFDHLGGVHSPYEFRVSPETVLLEIDPRKSAVLTQTNTGQRIISDIYILKNFSKGAPPDQLNTTSGPYRYLATYKLYGWPNKLLSYVYYKI